MYIYQYLSSICILGVYQAFVFEKVTPPLNLDKSSNTNNNNYEFPTPRKLSEKDIITIQ